MNIENFTKVMDFVYLTGSKAEKVTRAESAGGKKIVIQEWPEFLPVATAIPGLIKALPEFVPEALDMDAQEQATFIAHAKEKYKLQNEQATQLVAKVLEIGVALWMVAKELFKQKEG